MYEALIPILACLVVFGAPGVYLHIIRSSRVRLREIELGHDAKLAELTRERDVLQAKVDQMEPNLEFFRQLATKQEPRKRIAAPVNSRLPTETNDDDDELEAPASAAPLAKASKGL